MSVPTFPRTRFFTFGYDHVHPLTGNPLQNCFIVLTENYIDEARGQIIEVFGNKWAFEYGREDYDRVIARFDLTRINLDGSMAE